MKLPIAIAVLVLVLAAQSEAQEEPTIEQRFASFQEKMKDFTDDVIDKTKATLDQIQQSEIVTKTKNFFSEYFEKMKTQMSEAFQN